jgi:hypothetical protein
VAAASSGGPDIPQGEPIDDAVAGLVKNVCEAWCCRLADKQTLVLFVPSHQFPRMLSRERFVELLEYCEEKLKCNHVLVCFNKAEVNPREGIPRALRLIGFTLLPPSSYPAGLDKNKIFSMIYTI